MRSALLALAALAVAVTVAVVPAGAITGNYQPDFQHDYVGLMVFYTTPDPETGDTFSHRCSGSLISPTLMVTAGHCTEGVEEGRAYFAQSVAPNYDPSAFGGLGGDPITGYPYFDLGPKDSAAFHKTWNYGFHDFAGYPDIHDVGVVELDEPWSPSGGFAQLPSPGAVGSLIGNGSTKKDTRFVSVGYGLSDKDPVDVSFRARLWAWSYLVNDTSHNTDGFNLQTTANASQGKGGTCNGDSGGPVLIEGTNTIASVTSFGMNAQCKGLDFSYRLDRPEVLAWILDPNRADAG